MENNTELISLDANDIKRRIFTIRGKQVMLDSDLAELYQVETKNLNKASNRNVERFPEDFRFKLTKEEFENLRFQTGTSKFLSLCLLAKNKILIEILQYFFLKIY